MNKLRVLDLFSGIGGFSLGLERTGGFETVAFCEIEEYPRLVLAKHWPKVPCYNDVRELTADTLARDGIAVEVICGGFPCQDISVAGKGAGLAGERSGLWREYARLVGELRPRFVLVENVAALLGRGLGDVLGDLAALGYDAEWHCISASALGAHHRRDRLWVVANSTDTNEARLQAPRQKQQAARTIEFRPMADAMRTQLAHRGSPGVEAGAYAYQWRMALAESQRRGRARWATEPGMGRVANGVSNRAHRIAALGNAVVPQIPELIGRAILKAEGLAA